MSDTQVFIVCGTVIVIGFFAVMGFALWLGSKVHKDD